MAYFAQNFKNMKKFSFADKFRLTDRFREGKITVILDKVIDPDGKDGVKRDGRYWEFSDGDRIHARFDEGDSVVVMSSYREEGLDPAVFGESPGWSDKQQANPKYMLSHFIVEKVRCVRVQDLTEEEVLRAGVQKNAGGLYFVGGACGGYEETFQRMHERLFNRLSKVVYQDNPWVIVYDVTPVVRKA